jgi:hypothetical protein
LRAREAFAVFAPCALPSSPPGRCARCAQADPPATSAKEAVLSEERFKQLDQLLNRTGLYTQVLGPGALGLCDAARKGAARRSC